MELAGRVEQTELVRMDHKDLAEAEAVFEEGCNSVAWATSEAPQRTGALEPINFAKMYTNPRKL